jgi:PsbP
MITTLVLQLLLLFPQFALNTGNDVITQSVSVSGTFVANKSHGGEMDTILSVDNSNLTDLISYENPSLGIRIQYPPDWRIDESIPDGVIFKSPMQDNTSNTSSEYLIVFVHTVDTNNIMTLDEFTQAQIEFLRTSVPNLYLNQSESATTMLAGNPAYKAVFDTEEGNSPFKMVQIWGIEGDKVLYITYRLEGDSKSIYNYIGVIDEMINSFEISSFLHYENPILGIKLRYPSDWEKEEILDKGSIVFATSLMKSNDDPPRYRDVVTVTTKNNLQNFSLDEHVDRYVSNEIKNDSNSKIIYEDNKFLLGKKPAHVLVYTTKEDNDNNRELVIMTLVTIINNRIYSVEYRSDKGTFSENLPAVQEMIDSIEIQSGEMTAAFLGFIPPAQILGIPSPILPPLGVATIPTLPMQPDESNINESASIAFA